MAKHPQEFTPELNAQILEAIQKRIAERQAVEVGRGQTEAARRGLTGGSFEARRTGAAVRGGQEASSEAALQFAVETAGRQREERLLREQRTFQAGESEKGRLFGAGEAVKGREFSASQGLLGREFASKQTGLTAEQNEFNRLELEKNRAFEQGRFEEGLAFQRQQADIQRGFESGQARKARRAQLLSGGIGAVGGAVGEFVGGDSLKEIFCFDGNTLILLEDFSTKPIKDIQIGDSIKGGLVESVRKSISYSPLHDYKGIKVTGSHAVNHEGEWVRVANVASILQPEKPYEIVYNLVTSNHRIWVGLIEFADEYETDFYESFTMDQSLEYLNTKEEVNV